MNKEILQKENKLEHVFKTLHARFDHDMRNRIGTVMMGYDVWKTASQEKKEKGAELTQAAWDKLFALAEQFRRGDFGEPDEKLKGDIGKLLALRDGDPLEEGAAVKLRDFFEEMAKEEVGPKEPGN
ncbi:MAG: hypothetical protein KGI60_01970 [Patescibacteria group bacterium]|nr:hypothetical protein [Patescibacteria group bacterium]